MKRRWYLSGDYHAAWPDALPWRGVDSALAGHGYDSPEAAWSRKEVIRRAYRRKHGSNGPSLRIEALQAIAIETE